VQYRAVIFDLDGVVCSTDEYHYLAWKSIADELGIDFTPQVNNRLRGLSRMDSLEVLLEGYGGVMTAADKQYWADRKNNLYIQNLENLSPDDVFPGFLPTLAHLQHKGIRTAIGSSSKNARFIRQGGRIISRRAPLLPGGRRQPVRSPGRYRRPYGLRCYRRWNQLRDRYLQPGYDFRFAEDRRIGVEGHSLTPLVRIHAFPSTIFHTHFYISCKCRSLRHYHPLTSQLRSPFPYFDTKPAEKTSVSTTKPSRQREGLVVFSLGLPSDDALPPKPGPASLDAAGGTPLVCPER